MLSAVLTTSEAPTQVGATLPRINDRDRRRATLTAERLSPGRYLAIEDGGEIVVISIGEGSLRLGRGIGSDVMLEDRSISRRHAVVSHEGAETVLLDDRSLNGVFVNGERVRRAVLEHGDTIVLGGVTMRFVSVD